MIQFIERDGHLVISTALLRFDFDTARGRFTIGPPDTPPTIRDATARARFDALTLDTSALRVASFSHQAIGGIHGAGEQLAIAFQPEAGISLALSATLYRSHPFLALRLSATNRSKKSLSTLQLTPLRTPPTAIQLGDAPGALSFFKNGYQSWSYTGLRRADQRDIDTRLGSFTRPLFFNLTTPISRQRGVFWSEMFGAVIDREAHTAIVAGQIGAADQFAQVFADTRPGKSALTLTCSLDGVPLAPGQSLASEDMFIQLLDLPVDDPFADYIDAVARQMNPRAIRPIGAGWCSWYYYFSKVREDDIIANLRSASDQRAVIPLDLMQVDDGFQTKTGDWLSINDKFPQGMKRLADRIREAGHTPGLWLAPFIAVKSSLVARQHPEWLIRDEDGRAVLAGRGWNERNYGLDMTHPGAQDAVRRVIETAVHEWGYPYLKLDFLYAAAMPGKRHDPAQTRAQALRHSLELIRETAGDETFLLGCGCPLGPAIGIVDGMRIGPDIALDSGPTWAPRYKGITPVFKNEAGFPSGRNAARNTLNRSSLHRRWWLNDPDCLIARPARHMNETEARSWASLVGLSGGLIVLSDDLPTLPHDRQRYVTSVLPPLGEGAIPLDLFEREMPELYMLRQEHEWGSGVVAGVFNWDDRPERKTIDLVRLGLDASRPYHAFEFWSGEYRRIEDGRIDLGTLPAHGCVVVAIRPVLDRPHLVATTFHLSMGGEVQLFEIENERLTIEVGLKRHAMGEIWIGGCYPQDATLNGQTVAIKRPAPQVFMLPIEVDRSARIELKLPTSNL